MGGLVDNERLASQETAVNIGFACSLLRTDMAQYIVNGGTKEVGIDSRATLHASR